MQHPYFVLCNTLIYSVLLCFRLTYRVTINKTAFYNQGYRKEVVSHYLS